MSRRWRRRYLLALASLALLVAVAACSGDDDESSPKSSSAAGGNGGEAGAATTSSTTSESGTGGQGGTASMPCQWSADSDPCPAGSYCKANDCVSGTCKKKLSKVVDLKRAILCGCDGITYWSPDVAQYYGASVASDGECPLAKRKHCGGMAALKCPKPGEHSCNQRREQKLLCNATDIVGDCWGLPPECPDAVVGATWRPCDGGDCLLQCAAVKSELAYYEDGSCE